MALELKERAVKHFLIKYRFQDGSPDAWRERIQQFIAAVEADGTLNGRIGYRCMKADNGSNEYYHLAASADDDASKALQSRDFLQGLYGRDQARVGRNGRGPAARHYRRD